MAGEGIIMEVPGWDVVLSVDNGRGQREVASLPGMRPARSWLGKCAVLATGVPSTTATQCFSIRLTSRASNVGSRVWLKIGCCRGEVR